MWKKVLVTAGNTRVPIDQVRGIDNIFTGRTGVAIAEYFATRGHDVILLASHPRLAPQMAGLTVVPFGSFDQLVTEMERIIKVESLDVIIHSAAVSDYRPAGVYCNTGSASEANEGIYRLTELDSSGKVGSDHAELWIRLVPTIKIIDQIRQPWGFQGTLVKFKLQVNTVDSDLIDIAIRSMRHSSADLIVANTFEEMRKRACLIRNEDCQPMWVSRDDLPQRLYQELSLS